MKKWLIFLVLVIMAAVVCNIRHVALCTKKLSIKYARKVALIDDEAVQKQPNSRNKSGLPPALDSNGTGKQEKEKQNSRQKSHLLSSAVAGYGVTKDLQKENCQLSFIVNDSSFLSPRDAKFGTPRFVGKRSGFLSPSMPGAEPEDVLRSFLAANGKMFTLHEADLLDRANASKVRDVNTKHNGMRSLTWQQEHNGLEIYGAHLALNLTKDNRIINVQSRALHIESVRFHDEVKVTADEAEKIAKKSFSRKRTQGKESNYEILAKNSSFIVHNLSFIYFPLDMISVVKAWDIVIEANGETHRVIVRADTGEVVENIFLTWSLEPVKMQVYANDSPTPFSPGMKEPTNYVPSAVTQTVFSITALDTNASPEGWIPDGGNESVGNNIDAYNDQFDDDIATSAERASGVTYRDFTNNLPYDKSVRQAFYLGNMFHDRLYTLGFDEAAGNFQADNFGRGGRDSDKILMETWNGEANGCYNQASITVRNDGNPARLELSMFAYTTPERDSALDAEVVYHECAHGVSSRLIGDGYGLSAVQSRGMAEGWSDFMALSLLSMPGDDPRGVYAFGAYTAARADWSNNYYYGIRRFPYCTDTNKSPQTFADTDANQIYFPPQIPRNPKWAVNDPADEIHRIGEIWCLALWECRADLISQYGFAGNEMLLQLVVDGMKLTPVNPTFADARDAILQADLVDYGGTNQIALWRGFAKRGLGYGAVVPESHSTVGIVESYKLPFDINVTVTETSGDGDGYVEPGESGEIIVALTSYEIGLPDAHGFLDYETGESHENFEITSSNTLFGTITVGGTSTSAPPFEFTVSTNFTGNSNAWFVLQVNSAQGQFDENFAVKIGNPYDYPPEILDVGITNITETNGVVLWKTGIAADGYIEYGTTTNYGFSTPLDPVMRTNHITELTGLQKGSVYHYRIHTDGTNGLVNLSSDYTFRTRARVYVNVNSKATEELGTITAPFKTLQAAADAAKTTGDEILVAWGTYTGTNSDAVLVLNGNEWDLTILGGYSDDFTACDPAVYVTVIDGERQRRGIWLNNGAKLSISGITVENCTHPEWGGGVIAKSGAQLVMSDCVIQQNVATNGTVNKNGGGIYATLGSTVELHECQIISNSAGFGGGIFAISEGSSIVLDSCLIAGNRGLFVGGGVEIEQGAFLIMRSSVVRGNTSTERSGGIGVAPFSEALIRKCSIAGNEVTDPVVEEWQGGGGISVARIPNIGTLDINNTIVAGNICKFGGDLHLGEGSDVSINYSCIGDIYGSITNSNHLISTDPLFANPAAGDFHLLYGSPCIDTGDPSYAGNDFDIDGEPRPFGGIIDMGADEFTDADADKMADYWEIEEYGDITTTEGAEDTDNDNLNTFGEYMHQTNPHEKDTDNDLAGDGWEVSNGYNPLNPDMDGDGMWDGWEYNYGLNAFINDASLNPDGDAQNNLAEFNADTDPYNSNSILKFLSIGEEWGGTRLDWKGGVNAWQWLESNTNLMNKDGWQVIFALPPPTPETNAVIIFGPQDEHIFYRIRTERK